MESDTLAREWMIISPRLRVGLPMRESAFWTPPITPPVLSNHEECFSADRVLSVAVIRVSIYTSVNSICQHLYFLRVFASPPPSRS